MVALVVMLVSSPLLDAQLPRPLGPVPEQARVAPFFDGWYANPDGTISLSFGYSNLNRTTVEIPLGPNNLITPKEYDGRQPTSFPVGRRLVTAGGGGANAGGTTGGAGGANNYARPRGVFTVTIPATYKGDVVWTLSYEGQTWSVPGRAKSTAYQLGWPMAMGSVPPQLRFQQGGPAGRGPTGIQGPPLRVEVGAPLPLTVWLADDAVHEKEPVVVKRQVVPSMNVMWIKHSGPAAPVVFSPPEEAVADPQGRATTTATFSEPGEYVIRVRGDAHGNVDSSDADQCCWTNGYWKVLVTR
jgi:hypothetical protein